MTATIAHPEHRLRALGLRLFGMTCLSTMLALVKLASESGIKLGEIMFWRQAVAVPIAIAWAILGSGIASLGTRRLGAHAGRSVLGLTGMVFNFGAVLLLPLAEATAINFTVPIFATILSALLLKENVGWHRWGAVIAGFAGVLILVQPGGSHVPASGAAVGLTAAVMIALISLQVRDLGRTEAPLTTVFWFSLFSAIVLGLLLPLFYMPHDARGWALLLSIGTLGAIGQVALTGSLKLAPVSVVVGMDYIGIIWATLFGWLLWDQLPTAATWIGAPVIIGSGLYIAWREHRRSIERAKDIAL